MVGVGERLALGTAQLGQAYGIANATGEPSFPASLALVKTAWDGGMRYFDTAQAYGDSERVLGACLERVGAASEVRVVSKLHPDTESSDATAIRSAVSSSLSKLGVPSLWGLLLHREEQLASWNSGLGATLRAMKEEGLVRHLGLSAYLPTSALRALEFDGLDLLQVPGNVFDRRMLRAGVFEKAAQAHVHVFVRSVYLQGLALMDPESVPYSIHGASEAVRALDSFCEGVGCSRSTFAVRYASERFSDSTLVLGAEVASQVEANLAAMNRHDIGAPFWDEWDHVWPADEPGLIDPSRWPVGS